MCVEGTFTCAQEVENITTLMFSKSPPRYCRGLCKTKLFLLHQGYAFVFLRRKHRLWVRSRSSVSTFQHSPLLETHPSCVRWTDTRGQERATGGTVKSRISSGSEHSSCFPWCSCRGGVDGNITSCCCLLWVVSGLCSWEVTYFSLWHSDKKYFPVRIPGQ